MEKLEETEVKLRILIKSAIGLLALMVLYFIFPCESSFLNGQKFNANNSHGICRLDFCGSSTSTNWIKLLTTNTILIRRGFQLRMCHFS